MTNYVQTYSFKIFIVFFILLSCKPSFERTDNGQPYFENFEMGECLEKGEGPQNIYKQEYADNTLEMQCLLALSCNDNQADIYSSNDTLFLNFRPSDSITVACECYFDVDFVIKNLKVNPNTILVNGRGIFKPIPFENRDN